MAAQNEVKKVNNAAKGKTEVNGHQTSAFCVATMTPGSQMKMVGDTPAEFTTILKDASVAWIDFAVNDVTKDSEAAAASFGFTSSMIPTLLAGHYSAYEDLDAELGLMMPAVRIMKFEVKINPVLILVKKGLILTIHDREIVRFGRFCRYAESMMKKFPAGLTIDDRLSMLLARILDENNEYNFEGIRHLEDQADELSSRLMNPQTPRTLLGPEIYKMKHALITYLDSLWATLDVVNFLRYGDAEAVSDNPKVLQRIQFLSDDIERKISLGEHMSEVLASGLEVLQTIYNNQLTTLNNRLAVVNNRLAMLAAWLAIMGTAVLVPNTIATVFGIPSLPIPDNWWPVVVGLLILSTMWAAWVTWLIVRRKGWMIPIEDKFEPGD